VNATRTQASRQVKAYLEFVNEVAEMIHQLDPEHPVAVGNLEIVGLPDYARFAPAVDIMGINSYRGSFGFGDHWKKVREDFDRPVLITEYGCDAYDVRVPAENGAAQAAYHRGCWDDIVVHMAGGLAEGNALGGVVYEYVDEWWKSPRGSWSVHDTAKDNPMAYPDGWANEEWLGIVSQGDGSRSPFLREPRAAYFLYKDVLWKR
jgi:beta-glucuronidase